MAGYQHVKGRDETNADAAPEQAATVRRLFDQHGVSLVVYRPRVAFDLSEETFAAALEHEFDVAERLGVKLLKFGAPGKPAEYDRFWELMPRAAEAAHRRGFTFVLKPHGGLLGTAADCLNVVRRLDHPAVRIAYDPGNVIHYTGADPLDGLPELAPFVKVLCVKDSTGPVARGGTVMIRPGTGRVDFVLLFAMLRDGGFDGPALVETLAQGTLEQVNRQARESVEYVRSLV